MWILSWLTTVSFHLQSTNWILHVDIILTDNSYSLNSTCGYYLDWQQYPFTCSLQTEFYMWILSWLTTVTVHQQSTNWILHVDIILTDNSYSSSAVYKLNSTCGYYLDWQQLQFKFHMWILSWLTTVTVHQQSTNWILHVDIILTDNSIHSPAVYKLNTTCGYFLDWQPLQFISSPQNEYYIQTTSLHKLANSDCHKLLCWKVECRCDHVNFEYVTVKNSRQILGQGLFHFVQGWLKAWILITFIGLFKLIILYLYQKTKGKLAQ